MSNKDKNFIITLIFFIGMIFCFKGWHEGFKAIENLSISLLSVLKMLNLITVQSTGDTILTLIFSSSITFMIVGIILELFNISKGKFGRLFGKVSFWLIGIPISFILNILGRLIFN